MTENVSLFPEKEPFVTEEKDLNISPEQEEAANFEPRVGLNLGSGYIILPQKNTGLTYDIPNVGPRTSKRLISVEDGEDTIRTIGVSSINAMGFKEKVDATTPAPEVKWTTGDNGKKKAVANSYKIHACDNGFIKGKDLRYIVEEAVVLTPIRKASVWSGAYENGELVVDGDYVVLTENDRFYFYEVKKATEEQIAYAQDVIKRNPKVNANFHSL